MEHLWQSGHLDLDKDGKAKMQRQQMEQALFMQREQDTWQGQHGQDTWQGQHGQDTWQGQHGQDTWQGQHAQHGQDTWQGQHAQQEQDTWQGQHAQHGQDTWQRQHMQQEPDMQQEQHTQQEWAAQEERLRMENDHYKQILQQLVQEEEKLHAANQERIKNGIHCLFLIPMLFFALLFLTKGEKAVFLVLWIVSLFVTAAYMIYIEYMDFQVKERLQRYAGSEEFSQDGLIGADLEEFEKAVSQLLYQIDEKKALRRRKMRNILQQGKTADAERKDAHDE